MHTLSGADSGVLDESLGRLRRAGPEYGGTLTNHAPMVVEALLCLGRPESVEPWLTGYLPHLDERPRAVAPVCEADWGAALGDLRRVTDWQAFFARQLAEHEWTDVLGRWWPALLPGVAAGATHGVIRTAHAARALAAASSPQRLAELGTALAYWAARYTALPGEQRSAGTLAPGRAVEQLPLHPDGVHPGLIRERLGTLDRVGGFPAAVAALRPPQAVDAAMSELVGVFARVLLTHGRRWPTAFVHAVTAPAAARSVLPLLPPQARRATHDSLWQLAAGLYAVHAPDARVEPLPSGEPPAVDDLVERAVANGDEHAIKLTEACVREYRSTGDGMLLHAADRGLALLPEL